MTPVQATADKESVFDRIADYVSAAMGRPTNIMIWLVLVVGWTLLFALHIVSANANFLPGWFTGTAFNFPLNLVTTPGWPAGTGTGTAEDRRERRGNRQPAPVAWHDHAGAPMPPRKRVFSVKLFHTNTPAAIAIAAGG